MSVASSWSQIYSNPHLTVRSLADLDGRRVALLQGGVQHALRLCQAVSAAELPLDGEQPLRFTTSIGVAHLRMGDESFDQLLTRADAALYMAKNTGRNRVCADPE